MIEAHELWVGERRTVYALVRRQRFIYEEDLDKYLSESAKKEVEKYVKILANDKLPITNISISRKLEGFDKLYELKPDSLRLFYFFFGRNAVIISGTLKGSRKKNQGAMERADEIRKQFMSENN